MFRFPAFTAIEPFDHVLFVLFILVHVFACVAPFLVTREGLLLSITMLILSGQFGMRLGYHRLLAHRSFRTYKPIAYFWALCGSLALQGGPISWIAIHRLHHQNPDQDSDPHSPTISFLWAHIFWLFFEPPQLGRSGGRSRLASDIRADAVFCFLERWHYPLNIAFGCLLFSMGYLRGGVFQAFSLLTWGYFIPVVYVWHATFLIVSVNHLWGYKNYRTHDNSRNTWWVALITCGDGWHNNHHAYPQSANMGHRWFELDPTYWIIRVMEILGLAREVIRPSRARSH